MTRDSLCSVALKVCCLLPQVKEQQVDLEDKVQLTNQLREQIVLLERRCTLMAAEDEELRGILEQTDRARKMAEHELVEVAERVNLLTSQVTTQSAAVSQNRGSGLFMDSLIDDPTVFQNAGLVNHKKKLEADLSVLTGEVDEVLQESRGAEEKAKKAITDVSPSFEL